MIILHFLSFFLKSSGGRKNILKKITQKGIFVVGKKIQSNYLKRKPRKLVHFLNKTFVCPMKNSSAFLSIGSRKYYARNNIIILFYSFFTILETFQIKSKSRNVIDAILEISSSIHPTLNEIVFFGKENVLFTPKRRQETIL